MVQWVNVLAAQSNDLSSKSLGPTWWRERVLTAVEGLCMHALPHTDHKEKCHKKHHNCLLGEREFNLAESQVCFQIGSHYVALAGLDLCMWTKLSRNSQKSTCLCLPSAGVATWALLHF